MSEIKLKLFCKCCGEKCTNMIDFSNENGLMVPSIRSMLHIFQGIMITDSDIIPNIICSECLQKLQASYNFHLKYIQSQKILQNLHEQIKLRKPEYRLLMPKKEYTITSNCTRTYQKTSPYPAQKRRYTCYECAQVFTSSRQLNNHKNSHEITNLCNYCARLFISKNSLNDHIQTNHPDFHFVCHDCKESFTTQILLFRHLIRKHNQRIRSFYCTICKEPENIYIGKPKLLEHISSSHPSLVDSNNITDSHTQNDMIEEFLDEMDEEFLDDIFLNQDENSFSLNENWDNLSLQFDDELTMKTEDFIDNTNQQDELRYNCPNCTEKFKNQQSLLEHLAHVHDKFVLNCNDCSATFNRLDYLEEHRSIHFLSTAKPSLHDDKDMIKKLIKNKIIYECNHCHHKYTKKINYMRHICTSQIALNTIKEIQCTQCTETFPSHSLMSAHRKIHKNTDKVILKCPECDKTYKHLEGLKYHQKIHKGIKAFVCPYCSKKFIAQFNLSTHIRTKHSEIKPYTCSLCDKKFATLDHLKKHVTSVHQKERNHLCNICGKSYSQSSHLTQHIYSHTGERPFKCDICEKGHRRRAELRDHMLKVHNKSLE